MKRAAALALALWIGFAACAVAQDARTVRLVVPVPAGGPLDATARLLAQQWQARGTPVVVENRPGANMLIGADAVARAPADGYTLLFGSTPLAIAGVETLEPVVQVSTETFGLFSAASGEIDSAEALARVAAARTKGVDCLSVPGAGEFACAQLRAELKERSVAVPFAGIAPAVTSLLGGHGDVIFTTVGSMLPLLRAGQVRLLAVGDTAALPPDVRPPRLFAQLWPAFVAEAFTGVYAPRGTPAGRVAQLNAQLNALLAEPPVQEALRASAQRIVGGDAAVLAARMRTAQAAYRELQSRLPPASPR